MQPRTPIRLGFIKRPLGRNYLIAYLLIGGGFLLGDIAVGSTGKRVLEVVGTTIFFAGLFVFAAAVAHSVWFIMGGIPPHSVKAWIGIILFFAVTVAAGLIVTILFLHHGYSFGVAVLEGSFLGFLGAWISMLVGYRLMPGPLSQFFKKRF
jgi:hypothetical protein